MPREWCEECRGMRVVVDDSMESDFGGPNHSEREVHVITFACGHENTAITGKIWPRPDGQNL